MRTWFWAWAEYKVLGFEVIGIRYTGVGEEAW